MNDNENPGPADGGNFVQTFVTENGPALVGGVVAGLTGNPMAGKLTKKSLSFAASIDPETTTAVLLAGTYGVLAFCGPLGWAAAGGIMYYVSQSSRSVEPDKPATGSTPYSETPSDSCCSTPVVEPGSDEEKYCIDHYLPRTYLTDEGGSYTVDPWAG